MNFKKFLEHNPLKIHNSFSQNTTGKHNDFATSAFVSPNWLYTDLQIPTTEKRSEIQDIEKNKNPIKIIFKDGTKIYLTIDEFNRINSYKKLKKGEIVTITFQRNPQDNSSNLSKIIKIS